MRTNIEVDNGAIDYVKLERGLRGPRCRWELAKELPFNHWDPCMRRYDEYVRAAHHFLELIEHSPVGAKQAEGFYPHIVAALTLDEDADKVANLKIAVFGDLAPAEITQRMGVDPTVLATWEVLFYDARQTRNHIGWVRAHIVDAELRAGNVDLATKLQFVAAVGSLGATTLLDVGSRAPADEGERLFRQKLALHLKFERALAMTEGPQHAAHFATHFSKLNVQQQRLKLREQALAEKCNRALRKHELAKIREQAALERSKRRQTAKETRRAEELVLRREGQRFACELEAAHRQERELAEQNEAEARAAASPLARLRWKKAEDSPVKPTILTIAPKLEIDVPAELPVSVPFKTPVRPSEATTTAAQIA